MINIVSLQVALVLFDAAPGPRESSTACLAVLRASADLSLRVCAVHCERLRAEGHADLAAQIAGRADTMERQLIVLDMLGPDAKEQLGP